MPLKIIRNDLVKMDTEAIVNTANTEVIVGSGCDIAVYRAAGYDELLAYRKANIGEVPEGQSFITPGFHLKAKYIIHTVSPIYIDGTCGEEELLRSCYRTSLELAKANNINSISFPLVASGSFAYPKEEAMRIAIDEINAFLIHNSMLVFLVVFDEKATQLGNNLYPDLESYIDEHYVEAAHEREYIDSYRERDRSLNQRPVETAPQVEVSMETLRSGDLQQEEAVYKEMESALDNRIDHLTDTFSEYLLYLISSKGMKNSEVYNRAGVNKKLFSKIKNNVNYHPQKATILCLCIGAKLNMSETADLLSRAGYALSPCDKTDIIVSYFIEHEIFDLLDIEIQLENRGLPCLLAD